MTVSTTPSIVAGKLTEADRAILHAAFIAHDRAQHQLNQVLTILGSDAVTLVTLLEQVRDGYALMPKAVRALLHKEEGCG